RREVHRLRVSPAARIRLEAAVLAELRQQRPVEVAAEVVAGVEGGRAVGLHGDEVGRAERPEVEGGQERDDGRRARLVAAHLGALRVLAPKLAWWTIQVASQSTRRWIESRTSSSAAPGVGIAEKVED